MADSLLLGRFLGRSWADSQLLGRGCGWAVSRPILDARPSLSAIYWLTLSRGLADSWLLSVAFSAVAGPNLSLLAVARLSRGRLSAMNWPSLSFSTDYMVHDRFLGRAWADSRLLGRR